jgi:predicted alpha/beta hydrolase family esterase
MMKIAGCMKLKQFSTRIYTYDHHVKGPCEWIGPVVVAVNAAEAQAYLDAHGMGYCKVVGQYVCNTEDGEIEVLDKIFHLS